MSLHAREASYFCDGVYRKSVLFLLFLLLCVIGSGRACAEEDGTTFQVKGAKIYYHVIGKGGPHLILINGGPGLNHDFLHFSPVWDGIAVERRVVFYDQRGNGRSPAEPDTPNNLLAQLQDIETLRTLLKAERVDLLGVSYGGFLAMAYAAKHPDRIAHLILADSAGPKYPEATELYEQLFPERMEAQRLDEFALLLGEKDFVLDMGMQFYSPEKRDAFISRWSKDGQFNRFVNVVLTQDLMRFDLTPQLARFTVPTLVTTGRFDACVNPATAYKIHKAIPGSKFVVFERSGHLPFYEEPEPFLREIKAFLEK